MKICEVFFGKKSNFAVIFAEIKTAAPIAARCLKKLIYCDLALSFSKPLLSHANNLKVIGIFILHNAKS